MNLKPPPGYDSLKPLDKNIYTGKGVREHAGIQIASKLNAIYLSVPEFFQAVRHFPIVFGKDEQADEYFPVVITGLKEGQNLFVGTKGKWHKDVYIPAYIRRYPFYTVRVKNKITQPESIVICVDENGLTDNASLLFNEEGTPTEEWQRYETLINDMETARLQTQHLCRSLQQLNLLEKFEAQAHPKNNSPMYLRGIYRVDEKRLNRLPGKTIKELMSKGELSRIYTHLISLDNFAKLLDLSASS